MRNTKHTWISLGLDSRLIGLAAAKDVFQEISHDCLWSRRTMEARVEGSGEGGALSLSANVEIWETYGVPSTGAAGGSIKSASLALERLQLSL